MTDPARHDTEEPRTPRTAEALADEALFLEVRSLPEADARRLFDIVLTKARAAAEPVAPYREALRLDDPIVKALNYPCKEPIHKEAARALRALLDQHAPEAPLDVTNALEEAQSLFDPDGSYDGWDVRLQIASLISRLATPEGPTDD